MRSELPDLRLFFGTVIAKMAPAKLALAVSRLLLLCLCLAQADGTDLSLAAAHARSHSFVARQAVRAAYLTEQRRRLQSLDTAQRHADAVPPQPSPPPSTYVAKNIVTDFGAVCNGVTDDAPAFAAFAKWARTQTLPVQLTIPSGSTCSFLSRIGQRWTNGIKQLLVLGYGATITNNGRPGSPGFFLGGTGLAHDNAHSARIATVSAGSTSVKLLTPSQASLFKISQYALITGFDLQGQWQRPYGYPPNPHFFEYVKITNIDAAAGVISFEAPLKNTYESTWPTYNSGSRFESDNGGPATLYSLPPSWDTSVEYRGLTISQDNFQTYADGRSVTYRDVTFTGPYCGIPTQNLMWQAINTNMSSCTMEVDKLIGTLDLNGVTIKEVDFQSSSTDLFSVINSNITYRLVGTPKVVNITHSTIGDFRVGAYAYGRTDEVTCRDCVLSAISASGVTTKNINTAFTMQNGVITVPNKYSAQPWAVPGTNLIWTGAYQSETTFQVIDVTQDSINTYVKTSLTGGFPTVPASAGVLSVHVHPAPRFTCTNCTGSLDAATLSKAPPRSPLFSYWSQTYTGTIGPIPQPTFTVWGALLSLSINVTTAYTGVGPASFHLSEFDNWPVISGDSSTSLLGPSVNVARAGERIITPFGTRGAQPGDSGLNVSQAFWLTGPSHSGPQYSPNVKSSCPGGGCPSVTVTIQTDQGLVLPPFHQR